MNAASDVVTNVQDGVKNAEDLLKNEVGLFKDCVVSNLSSLMDKSKNIFAQVRGYSQITIYVDKMRGQAVSHVFYFGTKFLIVSISFDTHFTRKRFT